MAIRNSVKSVDHQIKEFVKKISEEDLKWLSVRFRERVGGDLSEALVRINEYYGDLNRLLASAPNSEGVYDVSDLIDKYIQEEIKRRMSYRPK